MTGPSLGSSHPPRPSSTFLPMLLRCLLRSGHVVLPSRCRLPCRATVSSPSRGVCSAAAVRGGGVAMIYRESLTAFSLGDRRGRHVPHGGSHFEIRLGVFATFRFLRFLAVASVNSFEFIFFFLLGFSIVRGAVLYILRYIERQSDMLVDPENGSQDLIPWIWIRDPMGS